jgi:hypothetical protein
MSTASPGHLGGKRVGRDDLAAFASSDAGDRVDAHLGDGVWVGARDLLDLDAALDAGDTQVRAVGAVDEEGEVVLLGDVGRRCQQHPVDRVPLDVHAEDLLDLAHRVVGVLRELHPTGLATTAGFHLRPSRRRGHQGLSGRARLGRLAYDLAQRDRHAVLGESTFAWYSIRSTGPPSGCVAAITRERIGDTSPTSGRISRVTHGAHEVSPDAVRPVRR